MSLKRLSNNAPVFHSAVSSVRGHHRQTFRADRQQHLSSYRTFHRHTPKRCLSDPVFHISIDEIRLSQKICDISRFRLTIYNFRCADLFNGAVFHHCQPFSETQRLLLGVGNQHCTNPFRFQKCAHFISRRLA